MSRPTIDVIVPVWRHGREVVPSLRSILAAAHALREQFEVRPVIAAAHCAAVRIRALPKPVDVDVAVHDLETERWGGLVAAACAASDADFVAVLNAGDLVSAPFLSAADQLPADAVHRPETVVCFGRRTATVRQEGWCATDLEWQRLPRRLVRGDVWSATFLTRPETLQGIAGHYFPENAWSLSAAFIRARIPQVIVPGTATFDRQWEHDGQLGARERAVLAHEPLLEDPHLASGALPPTPGRSAAHSARLSRLVRAGARLARPWVDVVASRRRRRVGPRRFREALISQWRAANALEPLVPFPRPDLGAWVEDWDAPTPQMDREIDAYWWVRAQLPERVDYLFFAPWLRTGGADSVILQYIRSIRRQDPEASIALVTTEPVRSTRLHDVRGIASVVELVDILDRGVHRDALVKWVVPELIGQMRPHTVHAVNSTVAFDVIESHGVELAVHTSLFLSTFAIDRSHDGERLSVLFLRRPGFLDPVSAVLVDSGSFASQLGLELGYAPQKFIVQRSVVELPARARTSPAPPPLRVVWAGRFDIPKRLDLLARIADKARARRLPIEFHFYGLEVMGDPGLGETLKILDAAGAIRHLPYSAFTDLPRDDIDVYLLTSEWEGIPLSLLEAMASGIPAVAPLVGGVGEVLDDSTGYPIGRFDDIDAYVAALESIMIDQRDALTRAARARQLMDQEFSAEAFDARLSRITGYLR